MAMTRADAMQRYTLAENAEQGRYATSQATSPCDPQYNSRRHGADGQTPSARAVQAAQKVCEHEASFGDGY